MFQPAFTPQLNSDQESSPDESVLQQKFKGMIAIVSFSIAALVASIETASIVLCENQYPVLERSAGIAEQRIRRDKILVKAQQVRRAFYQQWAEEIWSQMPTITKVRD